MNTVGLIAARDFREFVRDGRLLWAGGLMLVLLLTALAVGWQRQAMLQAERSAAQSLDYDDWLRQGQRHPHDAAHQGMHVFKPEPLLSIVDPGIGPYVGSTLWLQAHRQSETKFRPAQDATGLQRFGMLSASWVVQVLGPLLIVVLGFNAFSGEREQGTLRQVMSLGVSSRSLFWGKALALMSAVAVLLVPAALVAGAAVALQAEPAGLADVLLRFGALSFGYAAYLGIAIFVVLAVSARMRTSRMALVSLLALWIAGVVLLPRVISDLSDRWYPAPSRTQFNRELDGDLAGAQDRIWRERFGVSTGWGPDLPLSQWGVALAENDKVSYAVLDRHFNALWDTFERQRRAQEWAGFVAPVLALRSYSMALAGTDFAQHRDFSVAAERQRRLMQNIISHDLVEHADPLGDRHFSYDADAQLWAQVPRFEYRPPSIAFAWQQGARSLAILCAVLLLAAMGALLSVPRRPVQ